MKALSGLATLLFVLGAWGVLGEAHAQDAVPPSAVHAASVRSLANVPALDVAPPVPTAALARRYARAAATQALGGGRDGRPSPARRFAEPLAARLSPAGGGAWETLPDGRLLWRTRITSDGATSLNLGFTRYRMPHGGALYLYAPGYDHVRGPFTAADNEAHGELWTPLVPGDVVVVEVIVPAGERGELDLELARVNHGFRAPTGRAGAAKSGACNVDVACPEGDAWQSQIRSVGAYSVNGVLTCSGVLVNNTAEDGTPYFLTAAHCGVTQANAQTVVVYWNYQHSTCRTPGSGASGASGDGTLDQFSTGATLRMQDPNGAPIFGSSDVTLLELDDPLDPDFDLYLAGWSRADRAPGAAVAIHHPGVEEKRISFENDPTDIGSYVTTTAGDYDPDGTTHVYVADWDLGTTEGGSSGSPLFDENRRIVGVLSGGFAACGNDRADWYGRLHEAWREAPSVGAPLADWLDPAGTDAVILDGREATSADKTAPAVVDDLRAAGVADTTATLAWTAPGDDGRTGTAQRYDLRLSTAPIPDAVAFAQATPLPAPPVPQPAGGNEAYVVTGLDFDTAYYVALVARDEAGNTSPLSNVASFRTDARPPIVVTSFTAQVEPNARAVALAWQSDGEIGPTQFVVERAEPGALFETLTVVEGRADDSGQAAYSYRLDDVDPNTYRFRVRATRSDGQVAVQEVEAVVPVPDDQPLFTRPIYPNPLQGGAATVTFAAPAPGPVVVQVFDVLGRRVRTLFDQSVAADDTQRVQLSPERLASGVYFVRIRAGGRIETRRLVIVR